jgi:16S rRNA C967 or C1407 C5-methylase (RsmB/RsmF family)
MTPASLLPIERGDKVLDICAAPGGKSTSWERSSPEKEFWYRMISATRERRPCLEYRAFWNTECRCAF